MHHFERLNVKELRLTTMKELVERFAAREIKRWPLDHARDIDERDKERLSNEITPDIPAMVTLATCGDETYVVDGFKRLHTFANLLDMFGDELAQQKVYVQEIETEPESVLPLLDWFDSLTGMGVGDYKNPTFITMERMRSSAMLNEGKARNELKYAKEKEIVVEHIALICAGVEHDVTPQCMKEALATHFEEVQESRFKAECVFMRIADAFELASDNARLHGRNAAYLCALANVLTQEMFADADIAALTNMLFNRVCRLENYQRTLPDGHTMAQLNRRAKWLWLCLKSRVWNVADEQMTKYKKRSPMPGFACAMSKGGSVPFAALTGLEAKILCGLQSQPRLHDATVRDYYETIVETGKAI